jgi:hypothetical protein
VRFSSGIEENIPGLQIAVKNPSLVCELNRAADLEKQLRRSPGRGTSLWIVYLPGERASLNESHAEEVLALALTDFIDRNDVRMIELGYRFRLGPEALYLHLARELPAQDHLQGHDSIEAYLASAINDTHSALGNFLEQLVIVEATKAGCIRAIARRDGGIGFRFQ